MIIRIKVTTKLPPMESVVLISDDEAGQGIPQQVAEYNLPFLRMTFGEDVEILEVKEIVGFHLWILDWESLSKYITNEHAKLLPKGDNAL